MPPVANGPRWDWVPRRYSHCLLFTIDSAVARHLARGHLSAKGRVFLGRKVGGMIASLHEIGTEIDLVNRK